MTEYTKGIDGSHWNIIRWLEWAAKGYIFVWLKATEGTGWIDPKWIEHYEAAGEAEFYRGPYHYFRVQWNGALQGQHFFETVAGVDWKLPPVVDVEKIGNVDANGNRLVSQAVFAARLRNCLVEVETLFERRPLIYTSKSMWQFLVGSADWATVYDLWAAHYTGAPYPLIPGDWSAKGWKIWQHTSSPLDQNRFNGDLAAFLKFIGEDLPPVGDLEERIAQLEAAQAKILAWARDLSYDKAG